MTKSVDYMHSQGKKGSEPVLGAGKFFTAGIQAPARPTHPNKHGMGTNPPGFYILFQRQLDSVCRAVSFTQGFHSLACQSSAHLSKFLLTKMAAINISPDWTDYSFHEAMSIHSLIHLSSDTIDFGSVEAMCPLR
jgi:hypothetical protein